MTGSGIIGTPAYMSPEQAQGEPVDNRSDIYGLGVIIFQMLSGHQPYEATTPMGVAVKHITDPVPEILKANPGLPMETDTIIKTAMAKDPSLRYQTATELATAMSAAAFGKKAAGTQVAGKAASGAPAARRSPLLGIGIAVLVLLAAAAAFFALGGPALLAPAPTATAIPPTAAPASTTAVEPTTVPATSGPAMAPVCAPGVVPELVAPTIVESNQYCVNKRAVTELTIPLGATFVSQREGYLCEAKTQSAAGQIVTCFGASNLSKFNLQVCIPQPTPSTSVVVGQCEAGNEYNYDNACCTPARPADAGCVTYEVSLRGCG
jgi:hypothetical protein